MACGLLALGVSLMALFGVAHGATPANGGLQGEVVFTQYSPLASNAELARRLLSPLTAARLPAILARTGKALREQPIDLTDERFAVYVPAKAPPGGYGLMVFVPPWPQAQLPRGWASALDRSGVIFVAAAQSGNEAEVLSRRAPLALLGAANIMASYRVDPNRVWVGGFSGGSRVALRLAVGYPDLFRGALLNAGADPIGADEAPLPPRDLFLRFQDSTRLVYVTGEMDAAALAMDSASTQSMLGWCVFDVDAEVTRRVGHEAADSTALARALGALDRPARPDPGKLAACRSSLEAKLAAAFAQVESLIAGGKRDDAEKLLIKIDRRFGAWRPHTASIWRADERGAGPDGEATGFTHSAPGRRRAVDRFSPRPARGDANVWVSGSSEQRHFAAGAPRRCGRALAHGPSTIVRGPLRWETKSGTI